jgi:ATP-dependent helicase HrpA
LPVRLEFPDLLPVSQRRDEIAAALREHPVVIVGGETGSGKTTQLPKICLLAGRGTAGLIGHTQPRRIAATSVARRIAEELGSPLGTDVGYKIRFNEKVSRTARIKLMTDGVLLAETQGDPLLRQYDTLIVDEAHERSLNIDFLLGYLKRLLEGPRRDDLKVVITSATIDAARFAAHFAGARGAAPVIEVSGRTYPVAIRWRPLQAPQPCESGVEPARPADDDDETDLPDAVESAIDELWREAPGDVLVFLPGEREIRETAEHLRRAWARRGGRGGLTGLAEIVPLYSRLSAAEQQRVFAPHAAPRVVLATNVAETSLTVPGIRYVVDSGLARVKRYRVRGKVEQLQIEPVSRAAADQRAGRCGRLAEGICIRLYDEADFARRPAYTDPEVLRSSLASVILRMKSLRLDDVEAFPFVDPPPRRAIADGYDLLRELDAIDASNALTATGRQLARLPVDPRIGRMLLAARQQGCLREVLVIAAALSVQDPRERPPERQQAADQMHARFADPRSDFVSWVRLWDAVRAGPHDGESRRAHAARLEREFLSVRRLREWADVHAQLADAVAELHWVPGDVPAGYEALHRALLAGLLGNLGYRAPDEAWYHGTHATRFWLHPSSGLARRSSARREAADAAAASARTEGTSGARWVMAAEMVDTTRLYARTAARIEPAWIEHAAAHLIRRTWSDPHWEKRAGQAVALERGTLYGLVVYSGRRVHYAGIDPTLSRELLIREALVAGDWETDCAFFAHNRRLVAEVQQLEAKMRRPDLLVDAQFVYDWFDAQVPGDVASGQQLERWWRQASRERPTLLRLSRELLLRKDAEGIDHRNFPRRLAMRGVSFEARYHFEPGATDDGVTLEVPLYALNQVDAVRCEWLVPGMRIEKVAALLKSLPQRCRRHLLPLDGWARGFVERVGEAAGDRPLLAALIDDLREHAALRVAADDFRLESLPPHLSMNFRVLDEHGRVLGAGRQLAPLRAQFASASAGSFQAALRRAGVGAAAGAGSAGSGPVVHGPIAVTAPRAPPACDAASAAPASTVPPVPPEAARRAGERFTAWTFGSLPELLELQVGPGETLVGYPALVDRGEAAELQVFDDPEVAQRTHRAGLRRLFAIALREPLRFLDRSLPDAQRLTVGFMPFGTAEDLRRERVAATLERCCLAEPLPADAAAFDARLAEARPRVSLVGQEVARTLAAILAEHQVILRRLPAARAHAATVADVERQLAALLPKTFVSSTAPDRFAHLPRYLAAVSARLEKLRADPARDLARMAEILPLLHNLDRARAALKGRHDPRLDDFRWLLEELRVSLFAQELRTPMPVSVKRLQRVWESIREGGA